MPARGEPGAADEPAGLPGPACAPAPAGEPVPAVVPVVGEAVPLPLPVFVFAFVGVGAGAGAALGVPAVPGVPPSSASRRGECGRAVSGCRAAAMARSAGRAPGTAPSAGSTPAASGPGVPWPAVRVSVRLSGAVPGAYAPPPPADGWPLPGWPPPGCPAGPVAPDCPAPSPPPGTVAVTAWPAGDGSEAGAMTEGPGEASLITATAPPPTTASASADAAIVRLDFIRIAPGYGGAAGSFAVFRRLSPGELANSPEGPANAGIRETSEAL